MAKIIARFADGRLLIQEDRLVEEGPNTSGYSTIRIGLVRTVESVLSIDAQVSGFPGQKLGTELKDVLMSNDRIQVQLLRCDLGLPVLTATGVLVIASGLLSGVASGIQGILSGALTSATFDGAIGSGTTALGFLSGITSGRGWYQTLTSGVLVSGKVRILANIIGF